MSLYDQPNLKFPKFLKFPFSGFSRLAALALISLFFGFLGGIFSGSILYFEAKDYLSRFSLNLLQNTQEERIIKAVNDVSPAVVSIVISKDLPVFEQYYVSPFQEFEQFFGEPFRLQVPQQRQIGTKKQEIGGGTGFIVSEDGMVLTNKHVVLDEAADYTVLTNDGKQFSAKVLARDPLQDLAILKIETESSIDGSGVLTKKPFSIVKLGDSDKLQIGQTVITIGNALGEFRNTISVGVISGLGRTITAEGGGLVETIEDVIQTDAAINKGNSGGPLLNLKGEVIGINTATVLDAQSIGFAIPVNKARKDIEQIKDSGKIVYPYLGIYYVLVTLDLREKFDLPADHGAWIGRDASGKVTDTAVAPDTAAEKAGLKQDDIILEFGGEKITVENSLAKIIQKKNPGDKVVLKVLRGAETLTLEAVLGEREE